VDVAVIRASAGTIIYCVLQSVIRLPVYTWKRFWFTGAASCQLGFDDGEVDPINPTVG
jgi:hypothetical protein